jgi:hypothetical protein
MKLQNAALVIILTATAGTAIGLNNHSMANPPANQVMESRSGMKKMPTKKMSMEKMMHGSFVKAEHPTKGMAAIVKENGKHYLVLDRDFKSDSGPDLYVLLHRSDSPSKYEAEDYISLGQLKMTEGSQKYEIPADTKLSDYKSAVIWCRKFNATFGYAPLT